MKRTIVRAALLAAVLFAPGSSTAAEFAPTRRGLAISCGDSVSPAGVDFCLLTGILLFDYDRVSRHNSPETLLFRVEYSLGAIVEPSVRLMTSANIIAHLYAPGMMTGRVRPYLEGGTGIIYTDYRVKGQGLRFNFNPLLGAGLEFGPDPSWFVEVRLHHISNANLDDENRGVNSAQLMLGRYF